MEDDVPPSEIEMPTVVIIPASDYAQGRFSDLETGRERLMVPITRLSSCSGAFRGKNDRIGEAVVADGPRISTPVTRAAGLSFSFSQIIWMLSERIFCISTTCSILRLFFMTFFCSRLQNEDCRRSSRLVSVPSSPHHQRLGSS